jgi:hypothetical protein
MTGKARSVNQYRPKGDSGAMPYSPQRDLANIYTPMMKEVFQGLDEEHWAPHLEDMLSKYGVTEDDMGEAVNVFVRAHQSFIRDRAITSPHDAFKRAGVDRLKPAVRIALFSRLGEVVMGGFFVAIRDVTHQGQISPGHDDFVSMLAAGRQMAEELSGHHHSDQDISLQEAIANAEELERILKQVQEQREEGAKQLATVTGQLSDVRETAKVFTAKTAEQREALNKMTPVYQQIQDAMDLPWFMRPFYCIGLTWNIVFRRKF